MSSLLFSLLSSLCSSHLALIAISSKMAPSYDINSILDLSSRTETRVFGVVGILGFQDILFSVFGLLFLEILSEAFP